MNREAKIRVGRNFWQQEKQEELWSVLLYTGFKERTHDRSGFSTGIGGEGGTVILRPRALPQESHYL